VVEIANTHILELWGKTLDQTLNKPLFEGLPEVKGQGLEELLEGVLKTGEKFVANERPIALPRDGRMEVYYINFVYAPFLNGEDIEGIIVVATDSTEQVLARRKIQDAEERARLAMDAVEMGTYDLDYVTNDIITSPRYNQIFGFADQTGRNEYISTIHPDDLGVRDAAHKQSLISGHLKYEARITGTDKLIRWIRAEGKVYFDEDKNALRLLGTVIDITDAKTAEVELTEINQRLAIALEAGNLGSYELNLETEEIKCNEQFKDDLGLKGVSHFTFNDLINIVIPDHRDNVRKAVAGAIKNNAAYSYYYQQVKQYWVQQHYYFKFAGDKEKLPLSINLEKPKSKRVKVIPPTKRPLLSSILPVLSLFSPIVIPTP
ncbi:MAG: PAS domain S-box protein, partial [Pedobacter sp.]